MECGSRLLGALELGGAMIFAAGLATRAAIHRLRYQIQGNPSLTGNRVLIIGADKSLGRELIKQFIRRGCKVAYAGPRKILYSDCLCYTCDTANPNQVSELAKNIEQNFGELDILVYAAGTSSKSHLEPIDEIADIVDKNIINQYQVISKFVPELSRRSGRFVIIDPPNNLNGAFSFTNQAIMTLSDTLIQQMSLSGSSIQITRALRRTRRLSDREDIEESVEAILRAVETRRCSVTLPTVKTHMKNLLRYIFNELSQMWNDTILQQHKLVPS